MSELALDIVSAVLESVRVYVKLTVMVGVVQRAKVFAELHAIQRVNLDVK